MKLGLRKKLDRVSFWKFLISINDQTKVSIRIEICPYLGGGEALDNMHLKTFSFCS